MFTQGEWRAESAQYLVVEKLPEVFLQRYGSIPARIYIRECYIKLYESITLSILNGRIENGIALVTGVTGIGKSVFLVYFLSQCLSDARFKDKRIALELSRSGWCHCFSQINQTDVEFRCVMQQLDYSMMRDLLVLSDIMEAALPLGRAQWMVLFCSPNPRRYREIMKKVPCRTCTMETWTERELTFAYPRVQDWYEAFIVFGGLPRYVIPDPQSNCHVMENMWDAMGQHGERIAVNFFRYGPLLTEEESYLLVHINPRTDPAGQVDYDADTLPDYTFASDYVFQQLVKRHRPKMLPAAVEFFQKQGIAAERYGAYAAGKLYEQVCLWLQPLDGRQLISEALTSGAEDATFNVATELAQLPHDWREAATLQPGVLYVPRYSNLQCGSMFYLQQNRTGECCLVVLQVTVGGEHSLQAGGLVDILLAYPEQLRSRIAHKAVVFVVPRSEQALDREQIFTTQPGQQTVSVLVQGFKQYVYRHELYFGVL